MKAVNEVDLIFLADKIRNVSWWNIVAKLSILKTIPKIIFSIIESENRLTNPKQ